MSEALFRRNRCIARLQRSWLRDVVEGCWHDLEVRGYKSECIQAYANIWLAFGEFMAKQGDCCLEHVHAWVNPFAAQRSTKKARIYVCRSIVRTLIRYLVREGIVPPLAPPPPKYVHTHADLLDAYAQFLRTNRGLSLLSIHQMKRCCAMLLVHLNGVFGPNLSATTSDAIFRFLTIQGQQYQRTTMATNCGIIRGFLAWLHRRGAIPRDLSAVVLSPRVFKHEQCPRYLTQSEVESVLSVIDRESSVGRRDYAMILLLAVYGLRGCEVIRLRLDDIDWARQIIHIPQRKAGNSGSYPLTDPIAQAIIAYLQQGRPCSSHREVFLAMRPPSAPLNRIFDKQVRKYLVLAGITIHRPGTHTFRYSCAQRLFDKGMPLKFIGDFLGHQNPDSTQRYTKIAIEQLRAVACNAGEELL